MAKFHIGQRIKKVRGNAGLGGEGIFEGYAGIAGQAHVMPTNHWFGPRGLFGGGDIGMPGISTVVGMVDDHWEPLIPKHQPCDADFKESLETLLEGLTRPCKGEV